MDTAQASVRDTANVHLKIFLIDLISAVGQRTTELVSIMFHVDFFSFAPMNDIAKTSFWRPASPDLHILASGDAGRILRQEQRLESFMKVGPTNLNHTPRLRVKSSRVQKKRRETNCQAQEHKIRQKLSAGHQEVRGELKKIWGNGDVQWEMARCELWVWLGGNGEAGEQPGVTTTEQRRERER